MTDVQADVYGVQKLSEYERYIRGTKILDEVSESMNKVLVNQRKRQMNYYFLPNQPIINREKVSGLAYARADYLQWLKKFCVRSTNDHKRFGTWKMTVGYCLSWSMKMATVAHEYMTLVQLTPPLQLFLKQPPSEYEEEE